MTSARRKSPAAVDIGLNVAFHDRKGHAAVLEKRLVEVPMLTNCYTALMDLSVNYEGVSLEEFNEEYGDVFSVVSLP